MGLIHFSALKTPCCKKKCAPFGFMPTRAHAQWAVGWIDFTCWKYSSSILKIIMGQHVALGTNLTRPQNSLDLFCGLWLHFDHSFVHTFHVAYSFKKVDRQYVCLNHVQNLISCKFDSQS